MKDQLLNLTVVLPALGLFISKVLAGTKSDKLPLKISKLSSTLGILGAIVGGIWVFQNGPFYSETLGLNGLGLSLRLDGLSLVMFGMVSIIGLVVLRYSDSYLDGEKNKAKFIGSMALTVGLVQIMVVAGNLLVLLLAWVAAGISLKNLILYHSERNRAQIAAKKKQLVSIFGNLAMLASFALLFLNFQTGDLATIFSVLSEVQSASTTLEVAALLLVVSAALKSAQLPLHGWLIEVMEAPTPVSALLHAGLLNAGPFLMIRFAFLLDAVYYAPIILFTLGAITAFYGAIVFATQPTIKNALAYSSVGHMGFSLMSCGLGVYAAGLLHLVAHSFYKAHAFLSSGSLVEKVRVNKPQGYARTGSVGKVLLGFGLGAGLFFLIANFWGISAESELQLLLIAGIILAGVIKLSVSAVDSMSYSSTLLKVLGVVVLILNSFFGLETLSHFVIGSQIPTVSNPSSALTVIALTMFSVFFTTIMIQTIMPLLNRGGLLYRLSVHARHGFYINVYFNKAIKSLNYKD